MKDMYDEIIEHKYGYCFKKDGNKLGGRKNYLASKKHTKGLWRNSVAEIFSRESKHKSLIQPFIGFGGLSAVICSGIKANEIVSIGVIPHTPGMDDYKTSISHDIAMKAVERNQNIMMVGLESNHDDVINKLHKNLSYVDGVPYNPLDEFDRPWMYVSNEEVFKMISEPKTTEVNEIGIQLDNIKNKALFPHLFNGKKPFYKEVKIEDGDKDLNQYQIKNIPGCSLVNKIIPEEIQEFNITEREIQDMIKRSDFYNYRHFDIDNLTTIINNIILELGQKVIVIDKLNKKYKDFFLENDKYYKAIIVNSTDSEIVTTDNIKNLKSHNTPQECLILLLKEIKGERNFYVQYYVSHNDKYKLRAILKEKENNESKKD